MTLINEYNTLEVSGVECWFSASVKHLKVISLLKAP